MYCYWRPSWRSLTIFNLLFYLLESQTLNLRTHLRKTEIDCSWLRIDSWIFQISDSQADTNIFVRSFDQRTMKINETTRWNRITLYCWFKRHCFWCVLIYRIFTRLGNVDQVITIDMIYDTECVDSSSGQFSFNRNHKYIIILIGSYWQLHKPYWPSKLIPELVLTEAANQ